MITGMSLRPEFVEKLDAMRFGASSGTDPERMDRFVRMFPR